MTHVHRSPGWRGAALLTTMLACLALAHGCAPFRGVVPVEPTGKPKREATRLQLLDILRENMARFYSLKARASVTVTRQDILVPATLMDEVRRRRGKPYRKRFATGELNGVLLLERDPQGNRKVRFSGQVTGAGTRFMLLGKDDNFWIIMPSVQAEEGPDAPRGRVFVGKAEQEKIRPEGMFSIRPQDICDLFLYDEAFDALEERTICFMERWDEFYVLNFLRPDWRPEHLFSKIWFDRDDLTVAIHQLFDGSGALVAEGRFGRYRRFSAKKSKVEAEIPTRAELIWPRDSLVIDVKLDNIAVNEEIDPKYFEPKIPKGYKVEELHITAKPEGG